MLSPPLRQKVSPDDTSGQNLHYLARGASGAFAPGCDDRARALGGMRPQHPSRGFRTSATPTERQSRVGEVIALDELDAVVAQDVVSGRHVEVDIRDRVAEQVLHSSVVDLAGPELEVYVLFLACIDLPGLDRIDEVDGLRDPRLELCDVLLLVLVL